MKRKLELLEIDSRLATAHQQRFATLAPEARRLQYVIDRAVGPLNVRWPPINLLEEGAPATVSFSPEHCVLLEA